MRKLKKNRNLREYDLDSLYWTVPLNTALESIGIKSNAMENVSQNYITDDDFPYHKVDIPSFFIVGAFDFVKEATIESYQKTNSVQKKIIFGPWYHNQEHSSRTKVGDEEFGQESFLGNEKILELALKWFEKWLKQEDTGITDQPEAKVFIMFSNRWMEFNEFPPRDITSTFYYLSAENKSNSRLGDGLLNTEKSSKKKFSSYIYDPLNPVPTNGGANFHFFPETVGIKDQREVELREDILVFTSLPITKEIIVIGNVKVQLFAATEGVDTDFTAKLVLVDKNGYAKNICDGIIRARHRDGIEYVKLIEPNKIYEYEIDLGHTAFSVTPGQKLRLEISSSNFPKYNRNFNVEEDPFFATKMKVVQQKIFHNKKYPSKLILPVLNQ
jgi:putative CocE/NonD family hydrolase